MKSIKIEIPQGHEIDYSESTFEKIVFKKIDENITWEKLGKINGFFITDSSCIRCVTDIIPCFSNENVFKTHEQAEAAIALAKLSQLIPVYLKNAGYENWTPNDSKFLSFPTFQLAEKFKEEQIELLEKAKMFI